MKKELKGIIIGVFLALSVSVLANNLQTITVQPNSISVIVNGNKITAYNFVYEGRTYVPLRAISENLGIPVYYDETTHTAYIGERKSEVVSEKLQSKYTPPDSEMNDKEFLLQKGDPFIFKDGVYFVTASYVDYKLYTKGYRGGSWNEETREVTWTKEGKEPIVVKFEYEFNSRAATPYDKLIDEILPLAE